ncbi:Sodium- and chloride-dependent GABA transporter 2 [Trichoplax sp. H2]|nr:Sodium- and chloride-dependent GABA transporter 2 [Trichoplax sp. H2]|eukprot:RDD36542.1 Sodium- and chloride-dependent GABA transporter 2 [Trichoplax sp. H2]
MVEEKDIADPEKNQISHSEDDDDNRESWDRKIDFILSCVGYAVGFGNLWRFPYLCYDNGGDTGKLVTQAYSKTRTSGAVAIKILRGAFLIPYLIFLFICGIPMIAMEMSIGQCFRSGPTTAYKKICPLFGGIGYAQLLSTFLSGINYVVIFAWVLFFAIASFINPLPWTTCGNSWNTNSCFVRNGSETNMSGTSPSQEFFNARVLGLTPSPAQFGHIRWELALLLLLAWTIIYLCVFKGIKWSGKVVYFTATFPYVVLIILFFRGVTLPGAGKGINFYLRVDVDKLRLAGTWARAGTQIFYSLGTAFGPMITFASYNKRSNNVLRDATCISLINCATSFFAGFVVFSVIGYMSEQQGLPVSSVVSQGPGLVFMVYPAGLATLPGANFWSIIFFMMLITLGIDSEMGGIEAMTTGIIDVWPKYSRHKELLSLAFCIVTYLLGLTCVTTGGFYIFTLINWYSAEIGLFMTALVEIIAVSYIYGGNRFARTIARCTKKSVWIHWKICWYFLTPVMIFVVVLLTCIFYSPVVYGNNLPFPWWGEFLGWIMTGSILACIITPGIFEFFRMDGPYKERITRLIFVPKTEEELEEEGLSADIDNNLNGNEKGPGNVAQKNPDILEHRL